jgi:hypothetical protein
MESPGQISTRSVVDPVQQLISGDKASAGAFEIERWERIHAFNVADDFSLEQQVVEMLLDESDPEALPDTSAQAPKIVRDEKRSLTFWDQLHRIDQDIRLSQGFVGAR